MTTHSGALVTENKRKLRKAEFVQLTSSLCRQPVHRIIPLSLWPHLSTQGESGGSVQGNAIGIDIHDADLDRGMVFRSDQSV